MKAVISNRSKASGAFCTDVKNIGGVGDNSILKQELLFPVSHSAYFTVMLCNWLSLWPADWILFVCLF